MGTSAKTFRVFIAAILFATLSAYAQTTSFMYQGSLAANGNYANGNYDFQFTLFDALNGGNQIGSTLVKSTVPVSNGTFDASLDFGANAFPGADRFLEIGVRPSTGGTFTTLAPRTQLSSAPYAIQARAATTAGSAATLTTPATLASADPSATLSVTNSVPGTNDPQFNPLPPAAVLAHATSTSEANIGVIGLADGTGALGVVGIVSATPTGADNGSKEVTGVQGIATSTTGRTRGISGQVSSPDGIAVSASNDGGGYLYYGGSGSADEFIVTNTGNVVANKFSLLNQAFFVGPNGDVAANTLSTNGGVSANSLSVNSNFSVDSVGNLNTGNGGVTANSVVCNSLFVNGSKHSVVQLNNGKSVALCAMEAPDNWFEDFGDRKLAHGRVWVPIDPTFAETANLELDYHVFLTPDGDCRGLYVAKKTSRGFEVRELGNGKSNTRFDYRIVSRRRGYEKERFEEPPRELAKQLHDEERNHRTAN